MREADDSGPGLRATVTAVAAFVVAVGVVAAVVALVRGRSVSGGIAIGYYLTGAIVILIGSAPTGGFSVVRGRWTRRRPTGGGSYALQGVLLGAFLIALGALFDLTRPF